MIRNIVFGDVSSWKKDNNKTAKGTKQSGGIKTKRQRRKTEIIRTSSLFTELTDRHVGVIRLKFSSQDIKCQTSAVSTVAVGPHTSLKNPPKDMKGGGGFSPEDTSNASSASDPVNCNQRHISRWIACSKHLKQTPDSVANHPHIITHGMSS